MPNEEPEGPNLPPKKSKDDDEEAEASSLIEIKKARNIELKGLIAAFSAGIIIISYIVYYIYYYNNGVKLNELYFISSGIGISIFTGLLFTFFSNIYTRAALLFTCVFYAILVTIYVVSWIYFKQPYAYLKQSLIMGLIIGIIYIVYDKFGNKPRNID